MPIILYFYFFKLVFHATLNIVNFEYYRAIHKNIIIIDKLEQNSKIVPIFVKRYYLDLTVVIILTRV